MNIRWYGHACFELTFNSGIKVLTDPFKPNCFNNSLRYNADFEKTDIITISHNHDDHNYRVFEDALYIDNENPFIKDNLTIKGIKVFHDKNSGKDRGENIVFEFIENNKKIIHFGDIGHIPSNNILDNWKNSFIIFIPIGGTFTIDEIEAKTIIDCIKPNIIIPMHYKTDYIDFPIKPINAFLDLFDNENIIYLNKNECNLDNYNNKIIVFDI